MRSVEKRKYIGHHAFKVSADSVDHLQGSVLLTTLDLADRAAADIQVFCHFLLADAEFCAELINIVTVDQISLLLHDNMLLLHKNDDYLTSIIVYEGMSNKTYSIHSELAKNLESSEFSYFNRLIFCVK